MTTFLILCAAAAGVSAIFLLMHGSPRRRPFARARLALEPLFLKRMAGGLIALMSVCLIAALEVERAIFAGVFLLSFAGGGLLVAHALCAASTRRKNR